MEDDFAKLKYTASESGLKNLKIILWPHQHPLLDPFQRAGTLKSLFPALTGNVIESVEKSKLHLWKSS